MPPTDHIPWEDLELVSAPNRGEYRVIEGSVTVSGAPILYGLDAEGRRHLFVPTEASTDVKPDRRSAGVHILPQVLEDGGQATSYIGLSCRREHLNAVFGHLVAETVQRLQQSGTDAYTTCRLVLARWRELIDRDVPRVLSPEAQTGLFAELSWLERMVAHNVDALENWIGPSRAVHDFRRGDYAVEVKSTQSRESFTFKVNGLRQLETPVGGQLWAAACRVEEQPAFGRSLPAIIDDLRGMGVDPLSFAEKLLNAGYDSRDDAHYASRSFGLTETRVYRVDDSFPRLTRESFLDGLPSDRISNIAYLIDLAGQPPSPLPDDEVEAVVRVLAGVA